MGLCGLHIHDLSLIWWHLSMNGAHGRLHKVVLDRHMARERHIMNKRSGFTLIELMIVVIIMAALAGMVLPRLLDRADDAKKNISRGEIASITTALKFYKLDNGAFPGQEDGGLKALMTKPASAKHWKGPYLEKDANDPWGRPYLIALDENEDGEIDVTPEGMSTINVATRVGVMSFGPDEDRIRIKSWSSEIN